MLKLYSRYDFINFSKEPAQLTIPKEIQMILGKLLISNEGQFSQ